MNTKNKRARRRDDDGAVRRDDARDDARADPARRRERPRVREQRERQRDERERCATPSACILCVHLKSQRESDKKTRRSIASQMNPSRTIMHAFDSIRFDRLHSFVRATLVHSSLTTNSHR